MQSPRRTPSLTEAAWGSEVEEQPWGSVPVPTPPAKHPTFLREQTNHRQAHRQTHTLARTHAMGDSWPARAPQPEP